MVTVVIDYDPSVSSRRLSGVSSDHLVGTGEFSRDRSPGTARSNVPRCLSAPTEARRQAGGQQQVIAAARVHNPGAPCCGGADTPKQVAAHRTLDRTPGILRHNEPS